VINANIFTVAAVVTAVRENRKSATREHYPTQIIERACDRALDRYPDVGREPLFINRAIVQSLSHFLGRSPPPTSASASYRNSAT